MRRRCSGTIEGFAMFNILQAYNEADYEFFEDYDQVDFWCELAGIKPIRLTREDIPNYQDRVFFTSHTTKELMTCKKWSASYIHFLTYCYGWQTNKKQKRNEKS